VSSSHVVFTSSSSVIKPLVTDVLTLRCLLRDGATTAIIGKRHAVSTENSQGQVRSDVVFPGENDYVNSQDFQPSDVIPKAQENDDVKPRNAQPNDVSFVHSLIISKDGAEIATVTDHMTATATNKTPDINVTGHIPGSGAEKGFLEMTWKYPGPDQSGNYQCTVLGTDQLGHIQTFTETVEVTDDSVSMNDVIGYIQQLQLTNDLQKTTNDLCTSTIANQSKVISEMNQKITNMDKETNLLTSIIANQSMVFSEMNQKITNMDKETNLLTSIIANQSKSISEMNQKMAYMEKEMAAVKQKQNTTVMFSAWLDNQVTLSPGQVVIFNQEVTNIGQHYSPSTGVFTCPVSGYYVFDVTVMGQKDEYAHLEISHNGARLATAWADDHMDNNSASCHVSVVLTQGDKVDVWATATSYLYGNSNRYCMFSGHLVNLL